MAQITALVDADIIVYRAAWAAEEAHAWSDGLVTLAVDPATLVQIINTVIESIDKALGRPRLVMALSDPKRVFRQDLYHSYKAGRKKARKPIAWAKAREIITSRYETVVFPGLEADDVLGILATKPWRKYGQTKVVCSIDKDLRQIPGLLFNWDAPMPPELSLQDLPGVEWIDDSQADWNFFVQALSGDATDGVPGCPGIGPKRSKALLTAASNPSRSVRWDEVLWPAIVSAYAKAGFNEEYALLMARLIRVLRASDWDARKKEVRLWHPRCTT